MRQAHTLAQLPFLVLSQETEAAVVANASEKGEQDDEDEPDAQVDDQVLRYALVLFDDEAGVVGVDAAFGIDHGIHVGRVVVRAGGSGRLGGCGHFAGDLG